MSEQPATVICDHCWREVPRDDTVPMLGETTRVEYRWCSACREAAFRAVYGPEPLAPWQAEGR